VRVQGRLSLRTWQELFGVDLPEMGVTTVGGLVMRLLGRVPEAGDEVEQDGIRLTVESVQRRRVGSVRMRLRPADGDRAAGGPGDA
jgi:CBS domain containing-hemolysin-like protein